MLKDPGGLDWKGMNLVFFSEVAGSNTPPPYVGGREISALELNVPLNSSVVISEVSNKKV